eukprot:1683507-Rhodomonas_salina.1
MLKAQDNSSIARTAAGIQYRTSRRAYLISRRAYRTSHATSLPGHGTRYPASALPGTARPRVSTGHRIGCASADTQCQYRTLHKECVGQYCVSTGHCIGYAGRYSVSVPDIHGACIG